MTDKLYNVTFICNKVLPSTKQQQRLRLFKIKKKSFMPIYSAINNLKCNIPSSIEAAQVFLNTLPSGVQEQLISAIYIGGEHLHSDKLKVDIEINRSYTDQIGNDQYAQVLYKRADNVVTYLDKLVACAKASGVDLNTL